MKIDKELLERAGKLGVKRELEANDHDSLVDTVALKESPEYRDVAKLAALSLAEGLPFNAVIGTVY